MKTGRTPKKARHERNRPSRPANAWPAFRRGLADALRTLEDGEFLVIAATERNYFVQFAGHGREGMRAEAASNTFLAESARLSDQACQTLQAMGWQPPTYVPAAGARPPATGSPNFYVDAAIPVPYARLASLAVRALRTVYRIRRPEDLTYKSFIAEGGAIWLPMLGIPREGPPLKPTEAAGAAGGTNVARTGRTPEELLPAQPGAKPVSMEVIEANLRGQIATCEAAFEEAVWQLARFYSLVRRYSEATACVTRLLERTDDPAKRAGGYLALGQLLEQQDRYADAETVYARGLEIQPTAGEIGYFLHNNRGYCLNLLGRHTEAEPHCRAAIALDPARHNAHKNLGLALVGLERFPEAAQALLEADRCCPADPRARTHLSDLLREHPELLETDPRLAAACRERLTVRKGHLLSGEEMSSNSGDPLPTFTTRQILPA